MGYIITVFLTSGSQWTTYGGMESNPVLNSLTFFEIASHYEFVVSQVILRWAIHLNVTVIPRSHDPRHILLNFKALNIELSDSEIKTISDEWLASKSVDPSKEDGGKDQSKIENLGTIEGTERGVQVEEGNEMVSSGDGETNGNYGDNEPDEMDMSGVSEPGLNQIDDKKREDL